MRTSIKIHDQSNLESRIGYKLFFQKSTGTIIPKYYDVRTFFFIPRKLGINPDSFPIKKFYDHTVAYLFFRIPKLSYKEMIGVKQEHRSPLKRIETITQSLAGRYPNQKEIHRLIQEARALGCGYHQFLEKKLEQIHKDFLALASSPHEESLQEAANNRIRDAYRKSIEIIKAFDRTKSLVKGIAHEEVNREFQLVQDFCTIISIELVIDLIRRCQNDQSNFYKNTIAGDLEAILKLTRKLGRKRNLWVDTNSSNDAIRDHLHYRSFLKRRIWSTYYLETRAKSLFSIKKQSGAMLAAALAGAWAIAAEIYVRVAMIQSNSVNALDMFNILLLITIFTLAYILKDRIKEFGRGKWANGIFRKLPDQSNIITYQDPSISSTSKVVGYHDEITQFIPLANVPNKVADHFDVGDDKHLDINDFTILDYRKRLWFKSSTIKSYKRKLRMVYDLTRINLTPIFKDMPTSEGEYYLSNSKLEAIARKYPKTSQIFLAVEVSGDPEMKMAPYSEFYSITINKEGIQQIDRL